MPKPALALFLSNWPVDVWRAAMQRIDPEIDVRVYPDDLGTVEDIHYAVAWLPPANSLGSLPNLKVVFSLGAGVDALLADQTLPDVPLVRVVDPDLTMRMGEYVVMHVLMHHRQQKRIESNQRKKLWDPFITHAASALSVGMLGLGVMGRDAGEKLRHLGFKVSGWSRSRKRVAGIKTFAGREELDAFLAQTDVLVCLLPLTADTVGIIDRTLIGKLRRSGPLGAPVLINAGRGKLQREADIIAALDAGDLHGASLDVFETEPLSGTSPLWHHPRVFVSPHVAADSDPEVIARYVLDQIGNHRAGRGLKNVVDRKRGY
jgi:glyoxylate/hydroxypyruvate reductase A